MQNHDLFTPPPLPAVFWAIALPSPPAPYEPTAPSARLCIAAEGVNAGTSGLRSIGAAWAQRGAPQRAATARGAAKRRSLPSKPAGCSSSAFPALCSKQLARGGQQSLTSKFSSAQSRKGGRRQTALLCKHWSNRTKSASCSGFSVLWNRPLLSAAMPPRRGNVVAGQRACRRNGHGAPGTPDT